ncbi:MAG: hypothetical protein ACM3UR_05130 [Bacteroidota bacterium]|jgi:predicted GH43/DUF377 family glycosyl hydrolase|nr:hypothetical protein [Ignavibacteria bacterium]MCU7521295.1 hypothetical protein [Ignavibacteria bacterium]
MKTLLTGVLFIFSLLFLSSCSKDSSTGPQEKPADPALGKVSLRLDKINAPSNVALVTATLSRADCDTLVKNLSMFDSSDAEVSFENIKTGTWHLKIEAKSSTNVLLYSGETDLVVEDSKTTDVYMTLTPVPTGVGSVYISVKWQSSGWIDYANNPIFTRYDAYNNPYGGVAAGKVLYENGKYRMWYMHTYEAARADINYAESIDGIHWHNVFQRPVLSHGAAGSFDSRSVGITALLKDDDGYKMYYAGYSNENPDYYSMGLAVSQDGLTWEKRAEPIFSVATEPSLCVSGVVKKDGVYYMYYTSINPIFNLNMAQSQDGIHWTKYSGNPILLPAETWELSGIVYPSVIYDGTRFMMIYDNWDRTGFGMATSTDGVTWKKDPKNPVFGLNNTYRNWASQINYPYLFKNGNKLRIYYTGVANGVFNMAVAEYQ